MKHRVLRLSSWLLRHGSVFTGSVLVGSGLVGSGLATEIAPTIHPLAENPLAESIDTDEPKTLTKNETDNTPSTDDPSPRPYDPLRTQIVCPAEPKNLTDLMIRDLPNYTNRVLQRTVAVLPWTEDDEQKEREGLFVRRPYRPSHVLVAGQVDLTPLDLDDYTYTTESDAGGLLTQVFFTTLSRQYSGLRFNEVQEYHWLFLTQTTDGWRQAFMFSSVDDAQTPREMLPPYESSQSSVGQAVQLWLRDCRAGAVVPFDS